jgi:hypothetical protein
MENPCISLILEANISPRPRKVMEISTIKINAIGNTNTDVSLNPIRKEIAKIRSPCISEVVIPPAILPSTMEIRLTGATMISLRNPNSLSHKTERPPKVEEKSKLIPRIPGTKKLI